ncbi:MAG: class I SAM-dependent methyltransferase [Betaproteobacteria bacterium]|jgi:SAM-dependent methyltransferase|nr:class I SAM-dependent methyltransferase [Betaproteobacteria bacterium]
MIVARPLAAALAICLSFATAALAQPKPEHGDEVYQPSVGQAGKDVIWVPTPDSLVTQMLQAAKTTKDDLVFDLGSGDGKIPIAAAKQYGAKSVGIEYNPDMAELARRNAKRAGVDNLVTIITGDIFKEDFTRATVVTMYLLPDLNLKLRPIILKMKPGTRVTSHQFHMGDWDPDESFTQEYRNAYLWIVPAEVAGEWQIREESGGFQGTLSLSQRYQKVGGTLTLPNGKPQPLLGASLRGDKLWFSFVDGENNLRTGTVTVAGAKLFGDLSLSGRTTNVTGARK